MPQFSCQRSDFSLQCSFGTLEQLQFSMWRQPQSSILRVAPKGQDKCFFMATSLERALPSPVQIFYYFYITISMTTHDKLLTNTTNRLSMNRHDNSSLVAQTKPSTILMPTAVHPCRELPLLARREEALQRQIEEAKEEQQMMLELFQQLGSIERGEAKSSKKLQRRCNKDIVKGLFCPYNDCHRNYSTQDTLNRHIKMKHTLVKNKKIELFHDYEPWPNLSDESDRNEPPDKLRTPDEGEIKSTNLQ